MMLLFCIDNTISGNTELSSVVGGIVQGSTFAID